jgi:LPXTG-motif cell wall-anchored protein
MKDSYIREDLFDNLSPYDYQQIMQELAPYQNTGMSDKASRKANREAKKSAKAEKKTTQGAGARRDAKAMRQKQRQDSRLAKVQAGGGIGNVLGKVVDGAKNIFGKGLDVEASGGGLEIDYSSGGEPTFFEKNKIPLIVGGVAVVGLGVYLLTKKKKK